MGLKQNGTINAQYPFRLRGGDLGYVRQMSGRSEMRNSLGAFSELGGIPNGHLAPSSWALPRKAGAVSAYVGTRLSLGAADLLMAQGRNIEGASTLEIAVGDAQLQLVVSATGEATLTITADGLLSGALSAVGEATFSLTVDDGLLGAIVSGDGSATVTLSAAAAIRALGWIEGTTEASNDLTPAAIAQAVGGRIVEAGYTADQILRLLAAVAAGNAAGLESGSPAFDGLDGSRRIEGTYVGGVREVTLIDAE